MGADHLIYSIDYPYKQPKNSRTFLNNTSLIATQLEAFSHGNAERVFHLN